jgi:hypothetical protein
MNYLLARIWLEKVAAEQRQSWFHQHPFLTSAMIGVPLGVAAFNLGKFLQGKIYENAIDVMIQEIKRRAAESFRYPKEMIEKITQLRELLEKPVRKFHDLPVEKQFELVEML